VKCWGANDDGEVGDGTKDARTTPTQVVGLTSGATAVAVGGEHACAITSGGGVKCWGRNNNGELGDGTTTNRTTPVQVVGLSSGVIAITAGEYHTCAITAGGRLVCWGDNGSGQLGDGTTTMRTTPVQVTGLTAGVEAVSGGFLHTCAVTAGGSAKCWGANRLADDDDTAGGQLGDGTYTGRTTPTQVKGLTSGVVGISAGEYHSCATLRTGGARCWGWNSSGELGNNTRKRSNVPVRVVGFG
jgi:alpha-tubulin suppressor-like RCC1 family protein